MKSADRKRISGIVAVSAGLLLMGTASAWYGSAWNRPYGSGAVTYERQNMMRGHGYVMRELSGMLEGRRVFNRDEAVRLARELEEGFGDSLISRYAPGTWVAGSRTAPWTWNNFGAFRGYAEGARQSSKRLAGALDRELTDEEVQQQGVWVPPGMGHGPRHQQRSGLIPVEAIREYGLLNATCHSCHMSFRARRW